MIEYTTSTSTQELMQILALQSENLPKNISEEEAKEQGFVTVHHNLDMLTKMNEKFPHIIAKDQDKVIGYTLVMLPEFGNEIKILKPLFKKINELSFKNSTLKDSSYFVMGQVCINKSYRSRGVFAGLYKKMQEEMSPHFQYLVTEIATRNTRSRRAHKKVGFETVHIYTSHQEEWAIVAWDWR